MIELKNITKEYKRKNKIISALDSVSLKFEENGLIFITGPSGCGKTTLLNIIYGSVIQTCGEIYHNNILRNKLDCKMSYVFQEYNLVEKLNILDNIKIALKFNGIEKTNSEINAYLEKLGLSDILYAFPSELSGGQQQRVAIARASLQNANVILADEPTGALDGSTAHEIMKQLKELSKDRLVIVVSHNKELISEYADRIIEMNSGKIINDCIINTKDEKNLDIYVNDKTNCFLYLLRLGFKYINIKSIKIYLSFIMMIISLSLLLLSFAFLSFKPSKSYDSLNDSKYNYTIISKGILADNLWSIELLDESDINNIHLDNTFVYMDFGYLQKSDKKVKFEYKIVYSNVLENIEHTLVGEKPKENEILITKKMFDELDLNEYNDITLYGYRISGYIDFNYLSGQNDLFNLNDIIYVNEKNIESMDKPCAILTNKISYSEVERIRDLSNSMFKYNCDSICLDSVYRTSLFTKTMTEIGFPLSIVLITLSFLIIVNYIYSIMELNKNDIKILKMIGGTNKNIFSIFIVQPAIIITISFVISFILYYVSKGMINSYISKEMNMFIPILYLSATRILIILVIILFLLFFSVFIPLKRIKYSK